MKLTIVLLIAAFIQVHAAGYSQQINISQRNAQLEDVFKQIMKQTNCHFLYYSQALKDAKPVNIELTNASLTEALEQCFKGQPLMYVLDNNTIIVKMIQPPPITGKVTDSKGETLPWVTVAIKGTTRGTITDEKGNYSLEVNATDKALIFSYIGMITQEIEIDGRTTVDVVLISEAQTLDQVVIVSTGYQSIKKEKITGSTTTIGSKELERKNVTKIMKNLEATVPGLVYYNGTATIRGMGTLNASSNVLVVVDGLPIEGSIDDINPYDVENITVLKDAAATAIYGARASNGVIVVVTRKSKLKDKISVAFSSDLTINQKPDYNRNGYMTPSQQVGIESKYYDWYFNGGSYGTVPEMISDFENGIENGYSVSPIQYAHYQLAKGTITADQLNAKLESYKNNNFVEQYKKNALLNQVIQQYNLAVRTNSDKSESNLVVNYTTDNAGTINAYNHKLNISYRGTYKVVKWLDVNYGINSILGKSRSHNNYYATDPYSVPTYYSLFDDAGNRSYYSLSNFNTYSSYNSLFGSTSNLYSLKFNHLDELERDYNEGSSRNTRFLLNLNFKVIPGLTINPQFQYEDNNSDNSAYSEAESYSMRWLQDVYTSRSGTGTTADPYVYKNLLPTGGKLVSTNIKSPSYTARTQVNYEKELGKHAFSVIAGNEFRQIRSYGTRGVFFGYDDQLQTQSTSAMDFYTLSQYSSTFWNTSVWPSFMEYNMDINNFGLNKDTRHRYASGYANATYTYNKKYNIFGSVRKDYADLYGGAPKFRGSPLWSAGAAWNISREDFLKDNQLINFLKLRASYGVTGNISTDYTSCLTASITGSQRYTNLPTATVETPPNSKLHWEKTATTNIGLDLSMFDNRLRAVVDWYIKNGTDLLAKKRLDVTQGYTSIVINNGDMTNKGYEGSISYDWMKPIKANGFRWNTTLVLSHNKNEITNVDNLTTTPASLAGSGAFVKGYPVHSLFSYQYKGLDESGLPQYLLSDGTLTTGTVPSSDIGAVVYSGTTFPTTNISFNNELSYAGFNLSVFAVYYGGHYMRDNTIGVYSSPGYGALPNYLLNSWTPTNTNTDIPGFGQYCQWTIDRSQIRYADRWVKHADFIKIRNIVFGYELPENVANKIKASSVKIRFQVDNLKTLWTRDDLINDPETGSLPLPTSYVFGINVNF